MSETGLRDWLQRKAELFGLIREFFAARNVVEVTTPALSVSAATDPALHSLQVRSLALGQPMYLHTSPEHAMKRLLADGSGDIWQLARVFRDGELGRWHQPEFLLLEWYRTGFDEHALMDEVFALITALATTQGLAFARQALTYADAFSVSLGIDPHDPSPETHRQLLDALRQHSIESPAAVNFDGLLDLALSTVIVPSWPDNTVIFLHDYPVTQAALAGINDGQPPTAARFEVFLNGREIGNGFRELIDPIEQRRRFERDLRQRQAQGLAAVPVDEDLLQALERGLPRCAGVALGLERLLATLLGRNSLSAVLEAPHRR